jgi:hypothetical protein
MGVLGASTGTAAGLFRWEDGGADLDYTKIFGLGTLGRPQPMLGDLPRQRMRGGGIGFFEASEEFLGRTP